MAIEQTQSTSTAPKWLWAIPFVAATVLPGLEWVVAERPMAPRYSVLLAMTTVIAVIAMIFLAGLSRWFKYRIRWSMGVTAMVVLVAFHWPALTSVGSVVAASVRLSALSDALPVALAVAFLWTATRLGGEWQFAAIVGVALLIVSGLLLVNAQSRASDEPGSSRNPVASGNSPDVVMLILDGYAREDILDNRFGYDNSPFVTELEQLGFDIADKAHSNYGFTYASVSSMLELDYVFEVGEIGESDRRSLRDALSGDPALYQLFHDRGYEIAYTQNLWSGSKCGASVDICWDDGLFDIAFWGLGRMTIFAPFVAPVRPHPFSTISVDHLEALPDIVGSQRTEGVPRLTVAHILLPHQPFLLDAQCNRRKGTDREEMLVSDPNDIEPRLGYYVAQMQCTNDMVVDALTKILETREDTLVMVTGDHGSDSAQIAGAAGQWTDGAIAERMSILSAYRLPGCDDIHESVSPVNGVRALANCALDTGLAQLPDRHLWAPGTIRGTVVDIDSILSSASPPLGG